MTASTRQVFLVVRAPEEPPLKAAEVRSALLRLRTRSEIEVREVAVEDARRPNGAPSRGVRLEKCTLLGGAVAPEGVQYQLRCEACDCGFAASGLPGVCPRCGASMRLGTEA